MFIKLIGSLFLGIILGYSFHYFLTSHLFESNTIVIIGGQTYYILSEEDYKEINKNHERLMLQYYDIHIEFNRLKDLIGVDEEFQPKGPPTK